MILCEGALNPLHFPTIYTPAGRINYMPVWFLHDSIAKTRSRTSGMVFAFCTPVCNAWTAGEDIALENADMATEELSLRPRVKLRRQEALFCGLACLHLLTDPRYGKA